ncbi:MAG TPA: PaaI family thioesterase [Myxococcota bacterium]|nr:PaaI family thioesterase [Myxococcota bacterium]
MSEAGRPGPPGGFAWARAAPGRLIGRGHPVGDFLDAPGWRVLEEAPGTLRLDCPMPVRVRNPRGQLFGGFAPTYVDLIALFTLRAGARDAPRRGWLATVSMRLDFYEPVVGDSFQVESRLQHRRSRNVWVATRFLDAAGTPLLDALTVLRETDVPFDEA